MGSQVDVPRVERMGEGGWRLCVSSFLGVSGTYEAGLRKSQRRVLTGRGRSTDLLLGKSPLVPIRGWMCVSSPKSQTEAPASNPVIWRWGLWKVTG